MWIFLWTNHDICPINEDIYIIYYLCFTFNLLNFWIFVLQCGLLIVLYVESMWNDFDAYYFFLLFCFTFDLLTFGFLFLWMWVNRFIHLMCVYVEWFLYIMFFFIQIIFLYTECVLWTNRIIYTIFTNKNKKIRKWCEKCDICTKIYNLMNFFIYGDQYYYWCYYFWYNKIYNGLPYITPMKPYNINTQKIVQIKSLWVWRNFSPWNFQMISINIVKI